MTGPSCDLRSRVALITGASSGLGAHMARVLAAHGARVVLAARRLDRLTTLQAEIAAAGGKSLAVELDVADEASIMRAFDQAQDGFGPVDSVVANAGRSADGRALDLSAEAFDATFATNVRGVFLTAREGARRMIAAGSPERGHGRVVIVSSIAAFVASPGLAPYNGSKAAATHIGRTLAREWAGKGINVNALCPGYIETDLNSAWFQTEAGKRQIAGWPKRRLMAMQALEAPLLFLTSDASSYTTGAAFVIDDGQSLVS